MAEYLPFKIWDQDPDGRLMEPIRIAPHRAAESQQHVGIIFRIRCGVRGGGGLSFFLSVQRAPTAPMFKIF